MKPNDKAIEAGVKLCWDCSRATPSMIRDILEAAYAAQFPPSEDYAGLVKELRPISHDIHPLSINGTIMHKVADAIEAVLAERDTYKNWLDNYEKQFAAKVEELVTVRLERDALLARLAPVDDKALVEIAAKEFIEATTDIPPRTTYTISERSLAGASAAIAAIRPHIEAAERERCAAALEITSDEIRLHAGEMTAQEMRSVLAVLAWRAAAIRSGK